MGNLKKVFSVAHKWAWIAVATLIAYLIISDVISSPSVTKLNVIFGVITLVVAFPMMLMGVMGNDSGRGGFSVKLTQFMFISFPLVYLIGLISSIAILYLAPFENQRAIALWLSSIAGIHLVLAASAFGFMLLKEKHS